MVFSVRGGGGGVVVMEDSEGDGRVEEAAREYVGRLEVWRGWRERDRAKVKDGDWGGMRDKLEVKKG